MTVCPDCRRAESEDWGLFNLRLWCCRARMIVQESVPLTGAGLTLEDVRRKLAASEKAAHPEDWPQVRRRLEELKAREQSQPGLFA